MCARCPELWSRRAVLGALSAAGLAGCTENAATGRRQLVLVDDRQLVGLADRAWAEMAAKIPPVRDPAAHVRLARIGRRLVTAAGRDDLD